MYNTYTLFIIVIKSLCFDIVYILVKSLWFTQKQKTHVKSISITFKVIRLWMKDGFEISHMHAHTY